jgi:tRNA uridine 5-carboxymethylaminomethyl modification enzyme
LVAGLNAALGAGGAAPFVPDRADAYIGVLIDDLVTRGVSEPYRIFTSRAEYRLSLRADNADQRLTPRGVALGCVGRERAAIFAAKAAALDSVRRRAHELALTPNEWRRHGLAVNLDGVRRSAHDLLSLPDVDWHRLAAVWPELAAVPAEIAEQIEIDAHYVSYLGRQAADVAAFRRDEALSLPPDLDYDSVGGLSNEVREKLKAQRPPTLGAASRIPGVTPAALTALLGRVRRAA